MLFSCLKHSESLSYTRELYEIKFNEPYIEIEQKQDLITPLLIFQFLQLLKVIVKKGLKKSYYKVERNLYGKVKGKILISQTIKQNIYKNQPLNTVCQFDEFGVNSIENRVLKCTLLFIQKYLSFYPEYYSILSETINYCSPAFQEVDKNVDLKDIKSICYNSFFKEYREAIYISSLILRRFGYNIKEIDKKQDKVKVPPFWIDMSKLFELHVLGLLKERFGKSIKYQIKGTYGRPDFLLVSEDEKMIIDTKYRPLYQKERYDIDDIRQISGYARDTGVLKHFNINLEEEINDVIDCLIIYTDQLNENVSEDLKENLKEDRIKGFIRFYKMPIKLPVIDL